MTTSYDDLERELRAALAQQADAIVPADRLPEIRRRTAHPAWYRSTPVLASAAAAVGVLGVAAYLLGGDQPDRLVVPAGPAATQPSVSPAPASVSPSAPTPTPDASVTADPRSSSSPSLQISPSGASSPSRPSQPAATPSAPASAGGLPSPPPVPTGGPPSSSPAQPSAPVESPSAAAALGRGATPSAAADDLLSRYRLTDRVQVGAETTDADGRARVQLLPVDGPPGAGPIATAHLVRQPDGSWVASGVLSDDVSLTSRQGATLAGAVQGYDRAVVVARHASAGGAPLEQASSGTVSVETGWTVTLTALTDTDVLVVTSDTGYGSVGGLVVVPAGQVG